MGRFLQSEFVRKGREAWRWLRTLQIPVHAAHAGFFLILSLFPTLVLLLGLLRYTTLRAADLMDFVSGFLPEALQPYAWDLIQKTYDNTSRAVVSVSALAALWSAGKGIYGLMEGIHAAWGEREHRGWLRARLLCAGYMVMFLLVLLLTLVVHVFGSTILDWLRLRGEMPFWMELVNLRFFLLVALQTGLFALMYMYLPGKNRGFRESLPGALLASLGWMGASSLFSVYVERFSGYANMFGSVYAVALAMLWLYVCVSIVLYGAVLNRVLCRRAD